MSAVDRSASRPVDAPPAHGPSFQDLLEGARVGSAQSWNTLVDRYRRAMLRVVEQSLRGKPQLRRLIDAADVLQLAWLSLLEALRKGSTFPDEARFLHFLLAVTKNAARKIVRCYAVAKRRSVDRDEALSAEARSVPSKEPNPLERTAGNDYSRQRVDQLPLNSEERWVMVWWTVGYDPPLLAKKMQKPAYEVRRIIRRVLARWRKLDAPELLQPRSRNSTPRKGGRPTDAAGGGRRIGLTAGIAP